MMDLNLPIAIVGAGSIGAAWAIVFASAGYFVKLYDIDEARRIGCLADIDRSLRDLASFDLLAGEPEAVRSRIAMSGDLGQALHSAQHVQECAPEDLDLKAALFTQLGELAEPDTVLASSTSFIPASEFAHHLPARDRCLVVHPGNPPYLLRVAEVVPAPFTSVEVIARTEALLNAVGISPVHVHHEPRGFAFNRLQGALLREAYCLVRDGVVTPGEIDLLVRDGLGLRWSVTGPFETVDLNTRGGIEAHAKRMGPHYLAMGRERGQNDLWTDEIVQAVAAARRSALPLEAWSERTAWRDRKLMEQLRLRKNSR